MKFFKKASALAMCACMSISSYSFVMAADTTPKTASVYINGNELDLSGTTPLIKSDRVFVPLRLLAQKSAMKQTQKQLLPTKKANTLNLT